MMDIVKEKQRKWKDKVEAMSEDRLVKKVYIDEARGRRPRGRLMQEKMTGKFSKLTPNHNNCYKYCDKCFFYLYFKFWATSCQGDKAFWMMMMMILLYI